MAAKAKVVEAVPEEIAKPACLASGKGWSCKRPGNFALGLCHAHYQQQRRGEPLRPIRARGGLVLLNSGTRVTQQAADALEKRAKELKLPVYQVIARILEEWAALDRKERASFAGLEDPRREDG